MGKGRDKRKKREDPAKAAKRASRQSNKLHKHLAKQQDDNIEKEGLNNEEAIEVTLKHIQKAQGKIRVVEEIQDVKPPSPRVNVVLSAHPERDGELIIFGGEYWNGKITTAYNDTYFYRIRRGTWAKLSCAVNPAPRSSSQGIVYKHYLIIFGGEFVSQSQSQYMHFRDVWRFNSRVSEWEELKTLKGGPSSRSGHRMVLWKRNAVVFGGFYDNAQECRYYNDLWMLSSLEGAGKWTEMKVLSVGEVPHVRSGHNMAVYGDQLFVFGGYSTEKFNRFKKSEATVHHDLWMIQLYPPEKEFKSAEELPMWRKLRLGGVPPPIRCGVASAFKDARLYLFGGVVDIESPGGKMLSTFHNDLFVFHMDSKSFYPVVLRKASKKSVSAKQLRADHLNSLQAQLEALRLGDQGAEGGDPNDTDSSSSSSSLSLSEHGENKAVENSPMAKESYETNRYGQILPHRRMDASMVVIGNQLYLFGGQFESSKREVTMADLFSLNLNRLDTYQVLLSQNLSEAEWLANDSESDAGSWESGSTVVSGTFDFDYSDEEGEEEGGGVGMAMVDDEMNGDEAPEAIPAELEMEATPGHAEVAGVIDHITHTRGKKGLHVHKAQLLAQLNSSAAVPTPTREEPFRQFFERTQAFWTATAKEAHQGTRSDRRVKKEASIFARRRYDETKELLAQLALVEEREREEARFFKERRLQKEKEWEEYEREQQRLQQEEAAAVASALKHNTDVTDDEEDDESED
ncbi:unnamed protein product [Phytomonas sp. EM1]|nr:unnamed protein product [Phytomonas sp. EM1]|eukprot:CCW64961.1 unnamed protein product [Phytomonas sp. isolate EM1]